MFVKESEEDDDEESDDDLESVCSSDSNEVDASDTACGPYEEFNMSAARMPQDWNQSDVDSLVDAHRAITPADLL